MERWEGGPASEGLQSRGRGVCVWGGGGSPCFVEKLRLPEKLHTDHHPRPQPRATPHQVPLDLTSGTRVLLRPTMELTGRHCCLSIPKVESQLTILHRRRKLTRENPDNQHPTPSPSAARLCLHYNQAASLLLGFPPGKQRSVPL